jgi:glutathione S-transferase
MPAMTIQLYDLASADGTLLFSPYAWRVRMALLHKGLPFTVIPWRFSDRSATDASGHRAVPIIRDGERWVGDSWEIALYLDHQYPTTPTVLNSPALQAHARLVIALCARVVFPAAAPVALAQAWSHMDPASAAYLRETREPRFGNFETLQADETSGRAGLVAALAPFEEVLATCDYLSGEQPAFADFVLFGVLKWADILSPYPPLETDSALARWFTRLSNANGAHAAGVAIARGR